MDQFTFLGSEQTNVGLPDMSVVLANPGEVHDLDFPDPGPLWAAVPATLKKTPTKKTPAPAPPVTAPAPASADEQPPVVVPTGTASTDPQIVTPTP